MDAPASLVILGKEREGSKNERQTKRGKGGDDGKYIKEQELGGCLVSGEGKRERKKKHSEPLSLLERHNCMAIKENHHCFAPYIMQLTTSQTGSSFDSG